MEMVKQARSEFFMSKGILGSIAALLVSFRLISAQVPVYNGPPPDGGQAPPPLNHMEGPGDFHPGQDFIQFDHTLFASRALVLSHTANDGLGNSVITFDSNDTVTLVGVTKDQLTLHQSDFSIV